MIIFSLASACLCSCRHVDAAASGEDSGSGAGAGSDADAACAEVRQPGTDLWWCRCPLGRSWNGGSCEGSKVEVDWCKASGNDVDFHCFTTNQGLDLCNLRLGARYRLPTREDFSALFEESELGALDGLACNGDDGETICTEMFGHQGGYFWSSTVFEHELSWAAMFMLGRLISHDAGTAHGVRCLREGS
ncbi:MAG: hypothetical protein R6V85_05540 [Polyangia bacterium]